MEPGAATIVALYPAGVVAAVAPRSAYSAPALPEEEALLIGASEKRRSEFRAGRACARDVLQALDAPPGPILRNGRAPAWPSGYVGSISHCPGLCCAVAGPASLFAGLGLDVEQQRPFGDPLVERICLPEERAEARVLGLAESLVGVLAFSAKEAFYKCYAPLSGVFLEFHDVRLHLEPPESTGRGRFLGCTSKSPSMRLQGRWQVDTGFVYASAWLEA